MFPSLAFIQVLGTQTPHACAVGSLLMSHPPGPHVDLSSKSVDTARSGFG